MINVNKLLGEFLELGYLAGLGYSILGNIGEYPLVLMSPKKHKEGKRILISAGFHGEEPGGCLGLLKFLSECNENSLDGVSLSLLPIMNPTGIAKGQRKNDWGESTNGGFCHKMGDKPSKEGRILLNNLTFIKSLAQDGFISLHEDMVYGDRFFIYSFEHGDEPGPFSKALYDAEVKHFPPVEDGLILGPGGGIAKNAIIFRHCDGTFEDLLFHEGTPMTACTETPGKADLEKRTNANADIVKAFINFVQ